MLSMSRPVLPSPFPYSQLCLSRRLSGFLVQPSAFVLPTLYFLSLSLFCPVEILAWHAVDVWPQNFLLGMVKVKGGGHVSRRGGGE